MTPYITYAAWCRAVKAQEMRKARKKDNGPIVGLAVCLLSIAIVLAGVVYLVHRF